MLRTLRLLLIRVRDAAVAKDFWALATALGDLLRWVGDGFPVAPEGAAQATTLDINVVATMDAICDAPEPPEGTQAGLLDSLLGGLNIREFVLKLARKLLTDLLLGGA